MDPGCVHGAGAAPRADRRAGGGGAARVVPPAPDHVHRADGRGPQPRGRSVLGTPRVHHVHVPDEMDGGGPVMLYLSQVIGKPVTDAAGEAFDTVADLVI